MHPSHLFSSRFEPSGFLRQGDAGVSAYASRRGAARRPVDSCEDLLSYKISFVFHVREKERERGEGGWKRWGMINALLPGTMNNRRVVIVTSI